MPYRRGGQPGAVAVSYSTSTMAPLSPSRRYSGSTGSSSGGTFSASSGTTSNYGYLSSSSSGSDRPGSHHRRTIFSPARSSVSSYSESSSIVGSSSNAGSSLRYGSASSSSASSTASSTSSCGRERNGLGSNSSATTVAEIYAKYSVTNYVPNIYSSSKSGNGHWRPSSSSGFSSSVLAELHGGDEYDSFRERRDRSYSSEGSSGIGLSSNISSNGSGVVSPGLAERWSTRRESKRRAAPALGSHGVTVLAGHAHLDSAPAPTEVTLIDARNNVPSSSVGHGGEGDPNSPPSARAVSTEIENNRPKTRDNEINDRDVDNNNARNDNGNEVESIIGRESVTDLDRRRRRDDRKPGRAAVTDENNETDGAYDDLVLIRNNRDFNGDYCSSGRSKDSLRKSTIGLDDRRQARPSGTDESRRFNVGSIDSSVKSISSSASSLSSGTASSTDSESPSITNSRPASSSADALPPKGQITDERAADVADNRFSDKLVGGKSSVPNSEECGEEREADRRRTAYAWTKITTNTDNTELLTNNNGHDREADVLGVVERGRIIGRENGAETTRTSGGTNSSAVRRSLLWTTSNEIEANERNDDERPVENASRDEVDTHESGTSGSANGADDSGEDEEEGNGNGTSTGLRNGVVGRPAGTRGDDPGKPSTSRRNAYGWNDPNVDDLNAPTAASSSSASSSAGNSIPVAVHQNLYRGINEQIDESSNSRPPRNRLQSRRDERYGLNGLRNIGNTCFMNSVIQCLSNTRPLLEYLLNEQHLQDINTTTSSMKGALIKAFGQVIHELWEMSGDHVVNTTALKSQIQRFAPRFMGYSQQDAQEFLRYLLEGLHEDVNRVTVKPQPILTDIPDHYSDSHKAAESWKRYLRSEDSTIVDVFVGQLRSSLHCTSCDHVSVTLDPFWDLSLPIPVRSGTVKLNQCLEHFTKVETLDGDEKPTCSKCQMRRKCTKSFSIQKFPKILVIHLKRFSPTERFRGKLSVLVDFPLMGLDLSAFAAPGVQGCTYNLYGVANHSGTTYSGHYTAYCKHPYSGDWHEYNDNRVSTVPARSVVSSEAYVLFYEQQPLSPHL